jgi:hypothetical protein
MPQRDLVLDSVEVDKAERNKSFLPGDQNGTHIPTIERVISDSNIQAAIEAVMRNKGAPGINGVTVGEIKRVMQERWPMIKQSILWCEPGQSDYEPPYTVPYVRWCERTGAGFGSLLLDSPSKIRTSRHLLFC